METTNDITNETLSPPPSIASSVSSFDSSEKSLQSSKDNKDNKSACDISNDDAKINDTDKKGDDNNSSFLKRLLSQVYQKMSRNRKQHITALLQNTSFLVILYAAISFWRRRRHGNRLKAEESAQSKAVETSLSSLYLASNGGSMTQALLNKSYCDFLEKDVWKRVLLPPKLYNILFTELSSKGIDVSIMPDSVWERLSPLLLSSLPFLYLACVYKLMKGFYNDAGGKMKTSSTSSSSTQITMAHVAGSRAAKLELQDIISYLSNPIPYQKLGAKCPRGILLYGPCGTGKTLLARAVAGEVKCPFYYHSATEFVEVLVGRGAARIRSIFSTARKKKQCSAFGSRMNEACASSAAVIFIDEIDAIGKHRSSFTSSCEEREQTLNQLLIEMDGFDSYDTADNRTIIVIGATNRIDVLDQALLRPGRFDRHVYVNYPNAEEREEILWLYAQKLTMSSDVKKYISTIAKNDELLFEFSGADLKNIVNEAALLLVRDVKEGDINVQTQNISVTIDHFKQAVCKVKNMKKKDEKNILMDDYKLFKSFR